jgi:Zn-dependent protease with chaperone function
MKRVVLLVVTNLAVVALLLVTASLLGVDRFLTAQGLNLGSPLAFSALIGFGGSFLSLAISKWMAKMSTGAQVIDHSGRGEHLRHRHRQGGGLPGGPRALVGQRRGVSGARRGLLGYQHRRGAPPGLPGQRRGLWFSRQREYRADAGGASLAGRGKMIAALERLRAMQDQPSHLPSQMADFGINGGVAEGLRRLFLSHPPLEERIAALRAAAIPGDLSVSPGH